MAYQVFVSHTRKDKSFCDEFDSICARPGVGVEAFRSEFESIAPPAWRTIRDAMRRSTALFLLVGPQMVASQASPYEQQTWKYTQNWMAYEIGLACQLGIDVWVLCHEGVQVNFPVPYFNNYAPFGFIGTNFDFMRVVLTDYGSGYTFGYPFTGRDTKCPYNSCSAQFNLHAILEPGALLVCPQCLGVIEWRQGFNPS